jgi:hypothetical protein
MEHDMSAQSQTSTINQAVERELARRIDQAQAANTIAEVQITGKRYRLVPVEDVHMTDAPTATYDPQQMRAAIHAAAGTMKGVDRDELLADLRAERGQESIGRPAES